jgi:hypothetical protein
VSVTDDQGNFYTFAVESIHNGGGG